MNKKIRKNSGISLIILIITIIVVLILTTVSIISVNDSVNKGRLVAFGEDITKIQDATELYFIQNGGLPMVDGSNELTQSDILSLTGSDNMLSLQEELRLNGDIATEGNVGSYYKIDLAKLDVTSTNRGTLKTENDVYVISYPSMNVYYLAGIKVSGVRYFSFSSKITDKVKITKPNTQDSSETLIQTVSGITVKKGTKLWTNKMQINISASMSANETLYMSLNGGQNKKIVTNVGINNMNFDTLTDILNGSANITVEGLTLEEINNFEVLTQDKKNIEIIKINNSLETARIKVDLSNYETARPTIDTSIDTQSKEEYNLLTFKVSDKISGIKEVRYDYITKYSDTTGEIEPYYNNTTLLEDNFLKTKGKFASVSKDGNVVMKIPKNIQSIQIAVIDKAGNVSRTDLGKINIQTIDTKFYVGIVPKEITQKTLNFDLVINSNSGISTIDTSISLNGVSFENIKTHNVNSALTKMIVAVSYTDLTDIFNKDIYIKAVARDNSGNQETVILKTNYKDIKETPSTGNIFTDSEGNTAPIPNGFVVSTVAGENTVNGGLVIKEGNDGASTTSNEFVWVPVPDITEMYDEATKRGKLYDFAANRVSTLRSDCLTTGNYIEPANLDTRYDNISNIPTWTETVYQNEFDAMVASVKKYKGFYIGRYETGDLSKDTVVIKRGNTDIGNQTWYSMYSKSKAMISNGYVQTGVIWGSQWDATLRYMNRYADTGNYVTDSKGKGNYNGRIIATGSNEAYKVKNIYDMAGNVCDWTMETDSSFGRVMRGGYYGYSGNPASRSQLLRSGHFLQLQRL